MCMGDCGGGKSMSGKSSGKSQMPKNWGGMNTKARGKKSTSSSNYGSGGFGQPKVKMSFGSRGR